MDTDFTFPRAAINTVYASWWTLTLAKIFGRRIEGHDSNGHVVAYKWRGKLYLTEYTEDKA